MATIIRINKTVDTIRQEWFDLNYRMQEQASGINVNRDFLDKWILRVFSMIPRDSCCFWLFLSRINELALSCAAGYLNASEISAAAELLPIPIFMEGKGHIIETSDIFPECCEVQVPESSLSAIEREKSIDLLKARIIKTADISAPVIQWLYGLLARSGFLSENYLDSLVHRIKHIMGIMIMLLEKGPVANDRHSDYFSSMGSEEKGESEAAPCLFDRKIFDDMGKELHQLMRYGAIKSKYFVESDRVPSIPKSCGSGDFLN